MHQQAPLSDMFGSLAGRSHLISRSMEIIGEEGAGIIVVLSSATADSLTRLIQYRPGTSTGSIDELRDYGVGAQILAELGVHDMILLTNSQQNLVALDGYDLSVVGHRAID
jgi:3,4-dihydroxy 2-butanone 4-phosphate synthase/GTP cyclohydrolase II